MMNIAESLHLHKGHFSFEKEKPVASSVVQGGLELGSGSRFGV